MDSLENYIRKAKKWADFIRNNKGESLDLNAADLKDIEDLKSGEYEAWRNQQLNLFNEDKIWSSILKQIQPQKAKTKTRRMIHYWQSAAAVLLIGALGSASYFLLQDLSRFEKDQLILPGKSMAYLEINQNKRVELTAKDTLLLFDDSNAKLDSGKIVYSAAAANATEEKNEYHKINVPRNGEFFVQLSDGTKVWVNSESTIGFKSKFDGNTRIVDLVGEAYFEVAKDAGRPFVVKTSNMDVRVLGTHFNVKAYADETYTYATLNEGKVRIKNGNVEEDLLPDEQIVFNNGTKTFEKRNVDASIYSAWANGKFVFKDESLEDILIALSRWYDIKIFYQNTDAKGDKFSISVNRYDDINILLNHLSLTGGVGFELRKNALLVK